MKYVIRNNIVILIAIIITLGISIYKINQYLTPPIIEGNDADIANAIKRTFDKVKDDMEAAFKKLGDEIVAGIKKAFKPLIDFFEGLGNRFTNLGNGIKHVNEGLNKGYNAIGFMFQTGPQDVGDVLSNMKYVPPFINAAMEMEGANIAAAATTGGEDIKNLFEAVPSVFDPYILDSKPITDDHPYPDGVINRAYRYTVFQMSCGRKRIVNFAPCFFYYLLQSIGLMIYNIHVVLPIWLVKLISGVDISCYYDKIFDGINCIDDFWLGYSGYHLFHYSDYILNKCYYCDGMPHKGLHDNIGDPDPTQPVFEPPEFPSDLKNAVDNINIDYEPNHGTISTRLKYMGRFLGNNTHNIDDRDKWIIGDESMQSQDDSTNKSDTGSKKHGGDTGIDPNVLREFNDKSNGLNVFNDVTDRLIDDFKHKIPDKFHEADSIFYQGGSEIRAFFN